MERAMWDSKFYAVGTWIYRLALINILWVLFTLVGGIIFGIFPATIAMFSVTRKWLTGDQEIPIFTTFIKTYKSEFLKGNLLGYILLVIGFMLFYDIKFFQTFEGIPFLLSYVFIFLFFFYCVMLLFIFPVFVHFKLNTFQYIKHAFLMILISPFWSILLIVMTFLIYYLTTQFPPFMIFFGISIQVVMIMWMSLKVFNKIAVKHARETE